MTNESSSTESYKEKLRSLSWGKVPGGSRTGRYAFRPMPNLSWEKGIAGEHREDGSFMPYLNADGLHPMNVKQFADNRGGYESQIEQLKGDTQPKD